MNFSRKIIRWFEKNKRNLPWRHTKNPYRIWLSEIILQQTRVEQGLPYYLKFIKRFPVIQDLASASEEEVLKLWQGLGYYTRARNLHQTAKIICREHRGIFPDTYDEILRLPGVGKYTAAAIASFAYNSPYPVADGNAIRVLSRIYGITKPVQSDKSLKFFYELAGKLMDKKNPSVFNQAIMEFGALSCTPVRPLCEKCIFKNDCIAFNTNRVREFPVKLKKPKLRQRYFEYFIIKAGKKIFLKKRTGNDIWKNLYEFPLIETEKQRNKLEIMNSSGWENFFSGMHPRLISVTEQYGHILSHQKINARFWKISISKNAAFDKKYKSFLRIKASGLKNYPIPRLIEKYL